MNTSLVKASYRGHLPQPDFPVRRFTPWWRVELSPVMVVYCHAGRAAHLHPASATEGPSKAILLELGQHLAFESSLSVMNGGPLPYAKVEAAPLRAALPFWSRQFLAGWDYVEVRNTVVDGRPAVVLVGAP